MRKFAPAFYLCPIQSQYTEYTNHRTKMFKTGVSSLIYRSVFSCSDCAVLLLGCRVDGFLSYVTMFSVSCSFLPAFLKLFSPPLSYLYNLLTVPRGCFTWKSRFVDQRSFRGQITNFGDGIRFMYLEVNILGISCHPEVIFTNFRCGVSFHRNDDGGLHLGSKAIQRSNSETGVIGIGFPGDHYRAQYQNFGGRIVLFAKNFNTLICHKMFDKTSFVFVCYLPALYNL